MNRAMPTTDQNRQPAATLLIASAAIVALAYWLGAEWLSRPVLGVPGGLWAIAVVFAVCRWGESLVLDPMIERIRARSRGSINRWTSFLPGVLHSLAGIPARFSRACSAFVSGWRSADTLPGSAQDARFEPAPSSVGMPARSGRVRVGLDLPDHIAHRLMNTSGMKRIEWVPLLEHGLRPQELCRMRRLDAVLHRMGDAIVATPADTGPLDPLWNDWSQAISPITYAGVFPMRIDALRVGFGDTSFSDAGEREIAGLLIEALVHLRHAPIRMQGAPVGRDDQVMRRIRDSLASREHTHANWSCYRTACRLLSAWLCVRPVDWTDGERLDAIEMCARVLGDEPEVVLRLAAVRLVMGEDDRALHAILDADRLLRASRRLSHESQLAFVQSELSMGAGDAMTFGRVAAGLCLCAASLPEERLSFLRDDVLDEARFSAWLIDREDERYLLARIFRELEAARAGTFSQGDSLFNAA